jgi:hypothetical protein
LDTSRGLAPARLARIDEFLRDQAARQKAVSEFLTLAYQAIED